MMETTHTVLTAETTGPPAVGRILIVDDEEDIRQILSEILSFMGFEITAAGSGIEALEHLSNRSFDLVLTDLEMPEMDGWSLAATVKTKSPHMPVLMITGKDRCAVMPLMAGSGVDSVLFKPFHIEEIREAVIRSVSSAVTENRKMGQDSPMHPMTS